MFQRFFAWVNRYERHLSVGAMVAGATIDQLYFGRVDLLQTQVVFAVYAGICFVTVPLAHWIEERAARGHTRPRWRGLLPLITQFSLGGFWSGFLVFYGRSAVISASWPFLLLIIAILLGNEVLRRYHDRLVFTSVLFFFALYSYAIFAVPVYTGSIGTMTFLGSGLAAVLAFGFFTVLLRLLGRERFLADVWRIRVGAFFVLLLVNIFYFTNILPPLPLAAKDAGIYHSIARIEGAYVAQSELQPWTVQYLHLKPTLRVEEADTLYAYSSIFAPTILETTVVHRWQWRDPETHEWVTRSAVSYPLAGGRDGGYRGYTAALMRDSGEWRVSVETVDGRVIARLPFTVEFVQETPALEKINLP